MKEKINLIYYDYKPLFLYFYTLIIIILLIIIYITIILNKLN